MTDPRNIAHDKRLLSDKKHHGGTPAKDTPPVLRPGRKQRVDPAPNGHGHGPDSDEPIDKAESGVEP